jgi:hypothetical protein
MKSGNASGKISKNRYGIETHRRLETGFLLLLIIKKQNTNNLSINCKGKQNIN